MPPSQPQLPTFARQWVNQWKSAAPRLQAIRDEELRQLSADPQAITPEALIPLVYDTYPERNGLVIMQQWFQRQAMLELLNSKQQPSR